MKHPSFEYELYRAFKGKLTKRSDVEVHAEYTRYIPTNDFWYGNWDEGLVRVRMRVNLKGIPFRSGPFVVLTASGNDDFYLIKEENVSDESLIFWKDWMCKLPQIADHQYFYDWGFKRG